MTTTPSSTATAAPSSRSASSCCCSPGTRTCWSTGGTSTSRSATASWKRCGTSRPGAARSRPVRCLPRRPVSHNEPLGYGHHRSSGRRAPDGVPGPRRPSLQPPGADHLARRTPLPVVVAGRPRRGGAVADRRVRNLGRPGRDVVGARADRRRPARRLRRPGGLLVGHQGPRWPACRVRRRVGVRRAGAR